MNLINTIKCNFSFFVDRQNVSIVNLNFFCEYRFLFSSLCATISMNLHFSIEKCFQFDVIIWYLSKITCRQTFCQFVSFIFLNVRKTNHDQLFVIFFIFKWRIWCFHLIQNNKIENCFILFQNISDVLMKSCHNYQKNRFIIINLQRETWNDNVKNAQCVDESLKQFHNIFHLLCDIHVLQNFEKFVVEHEYVINIIKKFLEWLIYSRLISWTNDRNFFSFEKSWKFEKLKWKYSNKLIHVQILTKTTIKNVYTIICIQSMRKKTKTKTRKLLMIFKNQNFNRTKSTLKNILYWMFQNACDSKTINIDTKKTRSND